MVNKTLATCKAKDWTMLITWVPSKKAIDAGNVPENYKVYDIDTDVTPVPDVSLAVMATRTFRHMFNNEAASKYKAQCDKIDDDHKKNGGTKPPYPNKAEFLHEWRTHYRTQILEGKLGMRDTQPQKTYTAVESMARNLAMGMLKAHIIGQGGTFEYAELTPACLKATYEDKSVETWIGELLDREKSKRAPRIWALAEKKVAEAEAEAALLGGLDEDSDEEEDDAEAAE